MSSPHKFYLQHICSQTSYRANWLPDKPLQIGDIGKIEDGIFTLYTTLEQQGIPCRSREGKSEILLDYTSHDSVTVSNNTSVNATSATAPVSAKLSFSVEFKNDKSILFQTTGSKKIIIENLAEIENKVLEQYKKKEWKTSWVIITELAILDSATIIISTSRNNKIEFEGTGNGQTGTVSLADASLGLKLVRESGSSKKIITKSEVTPLYKVKGIIDPFFGKTVFRSKEALPLDLNFNTLKDLPYNAEEIED